MEKERKLRASPSRVLEAVLQKGISWYNYEELDDVQKKGYYRSVQYVLQNEALQNEVKHLIADLIQEITCKDVDETNNDVRFLRYSVNGIKVLMERLEGFTDPEPPKVSVENIHDVI